MLKITVTELRKNFYNYIDILERGKEDKIVVTRYGKDVLKLIPCQVKKFKPICGCGKGILPPCDIENLKDGFEDIPALFGY